MSRAAILARSPDVGSELDPDGYHNFTPGLFAVGEFQIFFSMISKEEDSQDRLRALEMFRDARFEAGPPAEAGAAAPSPQASR